MKSLAIATVLIPLVLGGCSTALSTSAPGARAAETRIYDTRNARYVTLADLSEAVSSADVVFFGEQHDDAATHRAELALLAGIGARRQDVIVSLEMFERDVQQVVDSYLDGAVAESVFVATSRPWPRYASDYRSLVELARAHGWPVVASNVPRRIASGIARSGLAVLDTMSVADRALVARDIACPRDRYYELFAQEMQGHSAGDANAALAATNRFYESQCVKDETMAESIVAARQAAGGRAIVVHYNGAFHSNEGLGTAARVRRRLPGAKTVVVTAVPVDDLARADGAAHASLGDYIVLTPRPRPQP